MFFRLYILIERNNFNKINIIGIYNYNDALEKKSTYESVNIDRTYTIEGPYEYSHNLDEKPNSFLRMRKSAVHYSKEAFDVKRTADSLSRAILNECAK